MHFVVSTDEGGMLTPSNDNKPRLVSMKTTTARVPFSRTTIMNLADAGDFPKPVRIGTKRIAFVEHEVDAWVAARIAARGAA